MSAENHDSNVNKTSVVEAPAQTSDADSRALDHVLGMADHYRADNLLRQAAEMYFEVLNGYHSTPESARAHQRLLEIAEHYENIGAPHQARGIYERLL